MGDIRLSGVSTGIDTDSLIKQLMAAESRRLASYQVKRNSYKEQKSAVETIRTKIEALKNASDSLSNISDMEVYNVNSSDGDILAVSASSDSNPGSHNLNINQLATSEAWIQDTSSFSYETDYVGGGNFIYKYNNKERIITTVDGQTTLNDLVNLINNDQDNPGVTASLLYQGDKYHLMLTGRETGQDFQISIPDVSTEVWKPDSAQANSTFTKDDDTAGLTTKFRELDQFSGTVGVNDKITISGKNQFGTPLSDTEIQITTDTTIGHLIDKINDHFNGIATATLENGQIVLTNNTTGSSDMEISLSFSGDAILGMPTMAVFAEGGASTATLASIPSSSFIQTQNAQNAEIKIDGYPTSVTNEIQTLSFVSGTPTTGTFKLNFNGQTTAALNYNATATEIQDALIALTGIESGDIVCTGSNLPAGSISIEFAGNLAGTDVSNIVISDANTLDAGVVSVAEETKGNSGWLNRNGNHINDAISGITLNLKDVTGIGESVKFTISRNSSSISRKIESMVKAYNGMVEEVKSQTDYDTEKKSMGLLSNDAAIKYLKSWAKNAMTGILDGFTETSDEFTQVSDIGITIDGAGLMEFDSEIFDDAISDNYKSVLEVLGAAKNGISDNPAVQFYSSSEKYTTPGTYNLKVEVDSNNEIVSAKIKLAGESTYRDATSFSGNIIFFDNTFDDDGNPTYPEHSLQLTVDLTEGVYGTDESPVVLRVKQGAAGALEELLEEILDTDGQIATSIEISEEKASRMTDKIEKEQTRLDKVEQSLVKKYARLEKTLTELNQQMSTVNAMMSI